MTTTSLGGAPRPAGSHPAAHRATHPVGDALTMTYRNLLRLRRYPGLTVFLVAGPVVILLLFVYVFGGTVGAGLPGGAGAGTGARSAYLAYLAPTVVVLGVVTAGQGVAIIIAMDVASGMVDRFRSMAVSQGALLSGHAWAGVLQCVVIAAVALSAAVLLGFRPAAGAVAWLALAGLVVLSALAFTWLCLAFGLAAGSVESASNLPALLLAMPFLGSGFVPVESMPPAVRWFAEHQPFTPLIETYRGLLGGAAETSTALLAVGWCVGIAAAGRVWARVLYRRRASAPRRG